MNHTATRPQSRGFTLIELLVVISIIGVLASMILPALSKAKQKAQIAKCRTEITDLAGAISAYQSAYNGRLPASKEVRAAVSDANPDFTYGTFQVQGMKKQTMPIGTVGNIQRNNSEVITILKDLTQFRSSGQPTANANHALNPEKTVVLNAKDVEGTGPGVGPDGVYRDPWGNPYIISLDLNYNEQTRDAMYSIQSVSKDPSVTTGTAGLNGTSKADATPNSYEVRTSVMVWSFGPDMQADPTKPANQGFNKDNILSWK